MKNIKTFSLFLIIIVSCSAFAKVKPHSLFSNNMVLQQNSPIKIYGTAENSSVVNISFSNSEGITYNATGEVTPNGEWQVLFPKIKGSFIKYSLKISDHESSITYHNILIGDVWVASGQSNMGWQIHNALPKITDFKNSEHIRVLRINMEGADIPQQEAPIHEDYKNSWQMATEEYASVFSAVAYHFSQKLYTELNIPIGIVLSAKGNTAIRTWISRAALNTDPAAETLQKIDDKEYQWALDHGSSQHVRDEYAEKRITRLYNGMISPLTNFTIKGVVWYQGENNMRIPQYYKNSLTLLIKSWRKAWNQGDFPFVYAQLPSYRAPKKDLKNKSVHWELLRNAQEKVSLTVPNTHMAVLLDLGEEFNIHPLDKLTPGNRLGLLASKIDKPAIVADGPSIASITQKKNDLFIKFKNTENGLRLQEVTRYVKQNSDTKETTTTTADSLKGFSIYTADGCHPTEATIYNKNTVKISINKKTIATGVSYGFESFPHTNLFNSAGFPAHPFKENIK